MKSLTLPKSRLGLTLLASVVIFLVAIGVSKLTELAFGLPEQNQVETVKKMIGWNTPFLLLSVWIVLGTPVVEEALFRLPTRYLRGDGWAAAISALFSFCHFIDYGSIAAGRGFALTPLSNAFLALFFVGFAWCRLYRRTGRLWCTMLSHSIFNTINLALLILLA